MALFASAAAKTNALRIGQARLGRKTVPEIRNGVSFRPSGVTHGDFQPKLPYGV
jgi:hypothetical protein